MVDIFVVGTYAVGIHENHIRETYKNLSWVWGADKKICPRVTWLASRGFAEWCQTVIQSDRFFNHNKQPWCLHTVWTPAFDFNIGVALNFAKCWHPPYSKLTSYVTSWCQHPTLQQQSYVMSYTTNVSQTCVIHFYLSQGLDRGKIRFVSTGENLRKPCLVCFCLCWGLTSQSTIFQSCRDGATASCVINQYFRGVKCLAQGHNTAAVGLEPPTSRSGVRHPTTEPPRSPVWYARNSNEYSLFMEKYGKLSPIYQLSLIYHEIPPYLFIWLKNMAIFMNKSFPNTDGIIHVYGRHEVNKENSSGSQNIFYRFPK